MGVLFTFGLLTQCNTPIIDERSNAITKDTPLRKLEERLMVEILNLAKEDQFRQFILKESLKQKHGDYNVYVRDIIAAYSEVDKYKQSMNTLSTLVEHIRPLVGNEPLVFYPRAETIEDEMISSKNARTSEIVMAEPLGVFQIREGGNSNRVNDMPEGPVDAYRAYVNGTWVWVQTVDEEYAWETDIYVIGYEENVSAENMVQTGFRTNGEAEYGGLIQVTNINGIEHWTNGKLEFRLVVAGASGAPPQNMPFGKWKRKNFRDNRWHDFNYFIGNWNTSTYGPWMSESWIEEDGGVSTSTTITAPASNGFPGYSITIPSKDQDDKLGTFTVQFTDSKSQIYNVQYANIKRR
jgi:hypothetical protein